MVASTTAMTSTPSGLVRAASAARTAASAGRPRRSARNAPVDEREQERHLAAERDEQQRAGRIEQAGRDTGAPAARRALGGVGVAGAERRQHQAGREHRGAREDAGHGRDAVRSEQPAERGQHQAVERRGAAQVPFARVVDEAMPGGQVRRHPVGDERVVVGVEPAGVGDPAGDRDQRAEREATLEARRSNGDGRAGGRGRSAQGRHLTGAFAARTAPARTARRASAHRQG